MKHSTDMIKISLKIILKIELIYRGRIIFSTGCRFIEVAALKNGVGEINLFSELLDWIAFILPISSRHRVGIKAIERFFRRSNLDPSYETKPKMQPKKPHFV